MTIEHHPSDEVLAAFAAGTLDHGQHVAIATHLVACPRCRAFTRTIERVGGAVLADLAPAAMSERALAEVEARLDEAAPAAFAGNVADLPDTEIPGLPGFVRRYRFGPWQWIAPSVHLRPIEVPHARDTRVFLLKSGADTKMLPHTHTGVEMTCILSGAFRQGGAYYGPGDFDFGDTAIDHQPMVEPGQDCVCLVAMHGELRFKGLLGRIIQPFVHL